MFLHSYHPSPIFLDLHFIQIHWYGFIITLSGLAGFFIFYKLATKYGFKKNDILNLFFWLIIAAIIGGRLYHVFSEFNYYWFHPLQIFYLWQGGLGIFGAIIASSIALFILLSKKYKKYPDYLPRRQAGSLLITHYSLLLDILAPALALGQSIGRWGNYFNQELYGLPTNLPWGIPIDFANRLPGYENFTFFQPLFLYESLFCSGLFIILLFWTRNGRDEAMPRLYGPGTIFSFYLFSYSLWRFFIEFLRIDPQPIFLNLRLGQWVSAGLIILSVFLYLWKSHLTNTKNAIK